MGAIRLKWEILRGTADRITAIARRLGDRNVLVALLLVVLFLVSLPAWGPLVSPGYLAVHDDLPPIRLFEMDVCFQDGQFPCRWVPDLNQGYGNPLFNYYAPLPYYVGELIHLSGVGFLDTVKLLFVAGFVLSGLFMFLLAREFWGNLGALVAAIFYVYAPYHAVDVYVRGALNEHWGIAFFPAVLWGIYKVIKEGKPAYVMLLALFIFAILLSHTLMVMLLFPLAVVWAVVFIVFTRQWARMAHLAVAGGAAFGLGAFSVLPALFEQDFTHVQQLRTGYFFYADHFPTMNQLFLTRFWGYGLSLPGDGDGIAFQIGWLHWGVTAASVLVTPFLWRRSRAAFFAVVVTFAFFWASVFMMQSGSDFLWRTFDTLQWQQFPWRFLSLAIFTSSFLAGAIVLLAKRRPYLGVLLSIVLIGVVIGLNQEYFRFSQRIFLSDSQQFSDGHWGPMIQSLPDYHPSYAGELPSEPAPALVQVIGGEARITDVSQGSDDLVFAAESTSGARVQTSVVDFPNWRVRMDGETIPHDHANNLAAITFDLPPGAHRVELSLEDTALRTFSNYVSMAAWALFLVAVVSLAGRWAWRAYGKPAPVAAASPTPSPPRTS